MGNIYFSSRYNPLGRAESSNRVSFFVREYIFSLFIVFLFCTYFFFSGDPAIVRADYVCGQAQVTDSRISGYPTYDYDSEGWLNVHIKYSPGSHPFDTGYSTVFTKDTCHAFDARVVSRSNSSFDSVENLLIRAEDNGSGGFRLRAYNEDTGLPDNVANAFLASSSYSSVDVGISFALNYRVLYWPSSGPAYYIKKGFVTEVWDVRQGRSPVLVIPGIAGTELKRDGETLWLDAFRILKDAGDQFMDELAFQGDHKTDDVVLGDVLSKPNGLYDYSQSFIEDLNSQANYSFNKDLFTFPYDWRRDIRDIALNELKQKVDELVPAGSGKKLDIVAHSQGGLLIKYLLYAEPSYRAKIGKLVLLGTPHLGAPKAGKVLLYGDDMGVSFLGAGLDHEEIKKIAKNMPSIYELLPSEEYFAHSGGYLGEIRRKFLAKDEVEVYDYAGSKTYLTSKGLNGSLLDEAASFHTEDFDNFDLSGSGVDTYNIVGCQEASIGQIFYRKGRELKITYVAGDGTVPVFSANNFTANRTYFATDSDHGRMLTRANTKQQILNILSGFPDAAVGDITRDPDECKFKGKVVSVHSPVEMHIYDDEGNHVGATPDGGFDYEIEGVRMDVFGEERFAFLPPDQDFVVKLAAIGDGDFNFYIEDVEGDAVTKTTYFSEIPIEIGDVGWVPIGHIGPIMSLDRGGDGGVDELREPDAVLEGSTQQDLLAPETTVTLSGEEGQSRAFRSSVGISMSSEDFAQDGVEASGVLKTKYRLDLGPWVEFSGAEALEVLEEGEHHLEVFSLDRVGNVEDVQTFNFSLDATAPELKLKVDLVRLELSATTMDNLDPSPFVEVLPNGIRAVDAAGNVTLLKLSEKDHRQQESATLLSLAYNGVEVPLEAQVLRFYWKVDKGGNLKVLGQQFRGPGGLETLVVSTPGGTQVNSGGAAKKLEGLWLVIVETNQGQLSSRVKQFSY